MFAFIARLCRLPAMPQGVKSWRNSAMGRKTFWLLVVVVVTGHAAGDGNAVIAIAVVIVIAIAIAIVIAIVIVNK
mgnify:CR=1 FL=1